MYVIQQSHVKVFWRLISWQAFYSHKPQLSCISAKLKCYIGVNIMFICFVLGFIGVLYNLAILTVLKDLCKTDFYVDVLSA